MMWLFHGEPQVHIAPVGSLDDISQQEHGSHTACQFEAESDVVDGVGQVEHHPSPERRTACGSGRMLLKEGAQQLVVGVVFVVVIHIRFVLRMKKVVVCLGVCVSARWLVAVL